MHPLESSCEFGARPQVSSGIGSRVHHFDGDFRWQDVPAADYKGAAAHHRGVTRMGLVGDRGEATAFHVRYFEIAPGGHSSLERHVHEHAVFVMRGKGQVQLGTETHELGFGDSVYVAPNEVHQFRNPFGEPFGFLCIVDAQRDRPIVVTD